MSAEFDPTKKSNDKWTKTKGSSHGSTVYDPSQNEKERLKRLNSSKDLKEVKCWNVSTVQKEIKKGNCWHISTVTRPNSTSDVSKEMKKLKCWPVSTVDTTQLNNKMLTRLNSWHASTQQQSDDTSQQLTRLNSWHDSDLNLLNLIFISLNGWHVYTLYFWQKYLTRLSIASHVWTVLDTSKYFWLKHCC